MYLFRGFTVRQYELVACRGTYAQATVSEVSQATTWTDCKRTVIFRTVHARVDDQLTDTVDSQ